MFCWLIKQTNSNAVFGGLITANLLHIKEVEWEETSCWAKDDNRRCNSCSHFLNPFLVFIWVFKVRWQHLSKTKWMPTGCIIDPPKALQTWLWQGGLENFRLQVPCMASVLFLFFFYLFFSNLSPQGGREQPRNTVLTMRGLDSSCGLSKSKPCFLFTGKLVFYANVWVWEGTSDIYKQSHSSWWYRQMYCTQWHLEMISIHPFMIYDRNSLCFMATRGLFCQRKSDQPQTGKLGSRLILCKRQSEPLACQSTKCFECSWNVS